MFQVFVNDGNKEMPNDDIMYIICKEGIFLKKKLDLMESITKVDKISTLQPVDKMAKLHIPPIPKEKLATVFGFLRAVYDKHKSEGMVLIFYDKKTKQYAMIPPTQRVSGASISYERDSITLEGYDLIGTIHSHANFSAFHSGTDHDDETSFDGLHITFGHVASNNFSLSISIMSNGQRFYVDHKDYMEGIEHSGYEKPAYRAPIRYYQWDSALGKLVEIVKEQEQQQVKTPQNSRYKFVGVKIKDFEFNKAWMDLVSYGYAARNYNRGRYYGAGGYYNSREYDAYGFNRHRSYPPMMGGSGIYYNDLDEYGDLYDWYYGARPPRAEYDEKNTIAKNQPVAPVNSGGIFQPNNLPVVIHDNLGVVKGYKNTEPPKKGFLEDNKCMNCVYRDHKLNWAFEILTESRFDKEKMPDGPLQNNRKEAKENEVTHPDETLIEQKENPDKIFTENASSGDFLDNIDMMDIPKKGKRRNKRKKKISDWIRNKKTKH